MRRLTKSVLAGMLMVLLVPLAVAAEIKVIEADSSYAMGDNDSKIDARRMAIQEAKRKALEIAGTYIESLTEVKDMAVTKDEVKAYTAGVVETEIVSEDMRGTVEHPEIFIRARCKIDDADLAGYIHRFRENSDLKEQLVAAAKETAALKKERDALVGRLDAEKDKAKSQEIREQLGVVISKEESNDETRRLWTTVASGMDFTGVGSDAFETNRQKMEKAIPALKRAVALDPTNQRALLALAWIYQKQGDTAAAEKEFRQAIEVNPSLPLSHMALGLLLKRSGRYEEAAEEFKTAHRMRPGRPEAVFHLGTTYKAMGNCREAVAHLKRFLAMTQRSEQRFAGLRAIAAKTIRDCLGDRRGVSPRRHLPRPR